MDYESLGFKCGLEIHQQLEGRKLFCSCPTEIRKGKNNYSFKRVLRASAGESGGVDKAARHEAEKSKEFVYQGYDDITCLVEADEEPPHPISEEAVKSALIMADLLNMEKPDSVQFMRKTVIDGSNTSGFQRTALIGYDGFIEVNDRKIKVESLCLEEESCQVIKREKDRDTYNLSRLGIPLLEIATAPDIQSPEECREVAAKIGSLLRSLPNVKRGLGSIRQDVNVSIEQGARTEVKGFQDHRNIPKVIESEIQRQLKESKKGKKLEKSVRKAEEDFTTSYLRPMPGADRMYPETDIEPFQPDKVEYEVPETLEDKENRYQQDYGLNKELARQAVKYESKNGNLEVYIEKYKSKNLPAKTIVDIILNKLPDVEKKEGKPEHLELEELFTALSSGKIAVSAVDNILKESIKQKPVLSKYEQKSEEEVERVVKKVINDNPNAPMGALMGLIMKELQGKADGKVVSQLVKKHAK